MARQRLSLPLKTGGCDGVGSSEEEPYIRSCAFGCYEGPGISEAGLLALLGACGGAQGDHGIRVKAGEAEQGGGLRSLSVSQCCLLGRTSFAAAAKGCCPLLESLDLDEDDLTDDEGAGR